MIIVKAIIPESNKTTGNIGVEYLIFKYRLNIYAEHFKNKTQPFRSTRIKIKI